MLKMSRHHPQKYFFCIRKSLSTLVDHRVSYFQRTTHKVRPSSPSQCFNFNQKSTIQVQKRNATAARPQRASGDCYSFARFNTPHFRNTSRRILSSCVHLMFLSCLFFFCLMSKLNIFAEAAFSGICFTLCSLKPGQWDDSGLQRLSFV